MLFVTMPAIWTYLPFGTLYQFIFLSFRTCLSISVQLERVLGTKSVDVEHSNCYFSRTPTVTKCHFKSSIFYSSKSTKTNVCQKKMDSLILAICYCLLDIGFELRQLVFLIINFLVNFFLVSMFRI